MIPAVAVVIFTITLFFASTSILFCARAMDRWKSLSVSKRADIPIIGRSDFMRDVGARKGPKKRIAKTLRARSSVFTMNNAMRFFSFCDPRAASLVSNASSPQSFISMSAAAILDARLNAPKCSTLKIRAALIMTNPFIRRLSI